MSIDVRAQQYGKVFGDWQFDKLVGSGSGGKTAVFQLKRPHSNWEEVSALKVVSIIEENGQLEQCSAFFKTDYENRKKELCKKAEEEVRIMYKMHGSAYVVNYFDYIFHDWKEEHRFGCDLLIRMEFLGNLREQIKQGTTYTETKVIQIGKDLCKALIGCHKENIIHRDIKPENIFQNNQGDYKLGDFGISRMVSRSQSASTMTGTQAYAAPEQFAQNGAGNYDYRVDIYSLGLVLYELCNQNRLPFAKSNYVREEEIQLRIMGKTLEKPCDTSSMMSEVILKACAYKPENRYQSAQEFLEALIIVDNNEGEKEVFQSAYKEQNEDLYETMPANASSELKEEAEFEKIQIKANAGDRYAQTSLGDCYYYGRWVEQNYKEAVKWYRKSAEQSYLIAEDKYGWCLHNGIGVEEDKEKGAEWYGKSAKQGYVWGQYNYGWSLLHGAGIKKNEKEAVKWYRKAAEQNCAEAQADYGWCLHNGIGVEKDKEKGVEWYGKSARQGYAWGQYNYAWCLLYGEGVEQDEKEAIKWFEKAAQQGNKDAKNMLENMGLLIENLGDI